MERHGYEVRTFLLSVSAGEFGNRLSRERPRRKDGVSAFLSEWYTNCSCSPVSHNGLEPKIMTGGF